jgi:hypothetical protein
LVQLCSISAEDPPAILVQIQELVNKNEQLFQEPTDLPPSREFDHHIPLMEGVKSVSIKLYRYNLTQKDEIE